MQTPPVNLAFSSAAIVPRFPHDTIHVLVVMDCADDFQLLSALLQQNHFAGYELDWAPTYAAGREALRGRRHDVAIFGYHLGGQTGLDLLREAREYGRDLPIILLTAEED